jgi:hypothetical protein
MQQAHTPGLSWQQSCCSEYPLSCGSPALCCTMLHFQHNIKPLARGKYTCTPALPKAANAALGAVPCRSASCPFTIGVPLMKQPVASTPNCLAGCCVIAVLVTQHGQPHSRYHSPDAGAVPTAQQSAACRQLLVACMCHSGASQPEANALLLPHTRGSSILLHEVVVERPAHIGGRWNESKGQGEALYSMASGGMLC